LDTNPTSSSQKKSFWFHTRWSLAWTFFVFGLCSLPGKAIPSSHWFDLISFDKFVHASIFWTLAVLWINGLSNQQTFKLKSIWIIGGSVVFSIGYGGLLEILQSNFFSDRMGEWNDFIANSFGALVAAFFHKPKWGYRLGILR
jgi:VanZ family protein